MLFGSDELMKLKRSVHTKRNIRSIFSIPQLTCIHLERTKCSRFPSDCLVNLLQTIFLSTIVDRVLLFHISNRLWIQFCQLDNFSFIFERCLISRPIIISFYL